MKNYSTNNKVMFKDGRIAKVDEVSKTGLLWLRDEKGYLSSVDPKTGWSGDGNWINDLEFKIR